LRWIVTDQNFLWLGYGSVIPRRSEGVGWRNRNGRENSRPGICAP